MPEMFGELELRQRGRVLRGTFPPYGEIATIRKAGRVRKERFAAGAFKFALDDAQREINLLVGHDYGQPLASKLAGSLTLRDSPKALTFEADLPKTTWAEDLRAGIAGKAAVYGVSPGFSVPPIAGAEVEIPEPGNPAVFIRELREVVLFEVSIVSRAAYSGTNLDLRAWHESDPQSDGSAHWRRRLIWALGG